jgi:hypothetical protein
MVVLVVEHEHPMALAGQPHDPVAGEDALAGVAGAEQHRVLLGVEAIEQEVRWCGVRHVAQPAGTQARQDRRWLVLRRPVVGIGSLPVLALGVLRVGRCLAGRSFAWVFRTLVLLLPGCLSGSSDPLADDDPARCRRWPLLSPEDFPRGAPVAAVLQDRVHRERAVAAGRGNRRRLERCGGAEHDEQPRVVAEGGADAGVLARTAQVGRATATRHDGPSPSDEEVLDARLGVGQRVIAVAGAIAVG